MYIFCICSQSSRSFLCSELLLTVTLNLVWCAIVVKWSYLCQPILLLLHSFFLLTCFFLRSHCFLTQYSFLDLQSQRRLKQGYLVYSFCWSRRKFPIYRLTTGDYWMISSVGPWWIVFCSSVDLYFLPLCGSTHFKLHWELSMNKRYSLGTYSDILIFISKPLTSLQKSKSFSLEKKGSKSFSFVILVPISSFLLIRMPKLLIFFPPRNLATLWDYLSFGCLKTCANCKVPLKLLSLCPKELSWAEIAHSTSTRSSLRWMNEGTGISTECTTDDFVVEVRICPFTLIMSINTLLC